MIFRLIGRAAATVLILVAFATPQAAATSSKTLLDALRKAMLLRPYASIVSVHTVASVTLLGIAGRAQEWDDVRASRFTTDQNAGALSGASGWDGKEAWAQDYAGLVTIDGGTAGRLQAIDQAYLDNLRYLRADAGGATVIYAGERTAGEERYDVLAVTPPNGSELSLWIDPRTHLIARVTATIGINSSTTVYSNYRRVDGVLYPFTTSTQTSSGNGFSQRVLSVELNADVADRIRVPAQSVHDYSVDGGQATMPTQVINNHVYLTNVRLGGHGPYTFVLDSGGDYIVTPTVASAIQARSAGALQLQGVGNATEGATFAHIPSIAIGNAVIRNQYALVLPIATGFGVAEGMRIDGMLGYQFLARFLTTIDYAGATLTLAMPTASPPAQGAAAMQFFLDGTIPRINVNVNDVTVSAEVDTGNRAGLELSSAFLGAHPGIAALAKTGTGVTGFGVGGPSYARLGRIATLQIGPYQIANSVALFSDQKTGALADPFNPANVGGAIWRRFTLTFDYARQELWLAKNPNFDQPFNYDRSGLFLIDDHGAYLVLSVLAGTPAAAA
ncbi:MAG: retropepsin-like domain-containing protein, partial [Candidatus Eremiobacteraeota bacterium]|nr:retropepsin-like domain-containing protein [Candidatus Eremiobacteraeota bacterium]